MFQAMLNKSYKQHPTKQQLYGHLPTIMKTIQVRRTRHAVHCWRSKDELISDIRLWTPSHGRAKAGRPAWTFLQQLCAHTGYSLEDLPGAMDNRDGWGERVREICAGGTTRWWWEWTLSSISTLEDRKAQLTVVLPSHIYCLDLVWFGLVLCHINHCRLFKAKSIFINTNSYISNNSVLYKNIVQMIKQFYFQQFSLV